MAGFLHNPCPCFDTVFAQLGVIPRTRNTSCYRVLLNYKPSKESGIEKAAVKNRRMSMKKEKNSSYLIYNIYNLRKIDGNLFHEDNMNLQLNS